MEVTPAFFNLSDASSKVKWPFASYPSSNDLDKYKF